MALSVREAIMARLLAVLTDTAGVDQRVYRSIADAMAFDECPCITIEWQADEDAEEASSPLMHRHLSVAVHIFTRGDGPDTLADPIAQSVHSLIMADEQLAGNALWTRLGSASFEFENLDKNAGKTTAEYLVAYRHSYGDLT